jgi:outer membrane protein OmpA-like peptidoglycan-associated protein/tetratricopeptide (TPR) repeat protein
MAISKSILLPVFVLFTLQTSAQWYDPDKVNKKASKIYASAIELAQSGKYTSAIQYMREAISADEKFVDAWLSMGGIFGEMKDYRNSIASYEKAFSMDSVYTRAYRLPCSINYAGNGQFKEALYNLDRFLKTPGLSEKSKKSGAYRRKSYEFAVEMARNNPDSSYIFAPRNMGDSINSFESEYFPSLTIDGKKLVFTRRLNNRNEDFFESNRATNTWGKASPIPGKVNTPNNEGAQNISQDGSILFFTGCNFPTGAGSCDLYYSLNTTSGWSAPVPAGRNINTEFWESQPCLSPDKKALYFAARGPGAIGGSDIFVSYLSERGIWGVPQNMGAQINTIGDESSPFLHADNQTFYFTSDGLTGYGGDDLFLARKKPDGKWGTPQNLGYPVNTIENEGSLIIDAGGETAYYASDRNDTRGGLDIYTFTIRKDLRPFKTLWIKGRVYDKKTKAGLPSSVELIDLSASIPLLKVQTDEQGNFLITLPTGKDFAFNVNRKGYLFYSENYALSQPVNDSTYEKNIELQPIEKNATIILKNIFFETAQFTLKPESLAELDKVVQLLNVNPSLKIEIGGHTDNMGVAKLNSVLSNNRAQSAVKYLVSKGIAANRLSAKGYAAAKPIAENNSEAGKAQNRRTELKVTGY